MDRTTWLAAILFALFCAGVSAAVNLHQDKPKEFKPTELQSLELQVAQRDAVIAQKDLQAAQQNYQHAITVLTQKANDIKRDNKWPEKVEFDPNSLAFSLKEPSKEPKP